jgi:hypothetical protein
MINGVGGDQLIKGIQIPFAPHFSVETADKRFVFF